MDIKTAVRKFIYGEPLALPVNAHILELYERANETGGDIVLETHDEFDAMMKEWGYERHEGEQQFDSNGREILGKFRPDTANLPPQHNLRRVTVKTSLKFIPRPPIRATRKQMGEFIHLSAASVAWLDDGSWLIYYDGHRVIEVPDGESDIDETLPINDVNGVRRKVG